MGIKFEGKTLFFFVDSDTECYGDCGTKAGGWRYPTAVQFIVRRVPWHWVSTSRDDCPPTGDQESV